MVGNLVYVVKTHIVCDCRDIADDVILFANKEDAQDKFNAIVKYNRNVIKVMELGYTIGTDTNTIFEAYDKDSYYTNHISIQLLENEIK